MAKDLIKIDVFKSLSKTIIKKILSLPHALILIFYAIFGLFFIALK